MRYIEIVGSPASGKSTLIDYRFPPDYIKYDKSTPPKEWTEFLNHIKVCLKHMERNPRFSVGKSLIERSIKKMTTVYNTVSDTVYIQTGFMQRALGIWTRVDNADVYLVNKYLMLCPKPLGVITLYADKETIKHRNKTRNKQDRSFMVDSTEECMKLVCSCVIERRIPLLKLNTHESIENNRQKIIEFERSLICQN